MANRGGFVQRGAAGGAIIGGEFNLLHTDRQSSDL